MGISLTDNDVGIIGWAFTDAENARKAHQALVASYANEPDRFRLWQVDEYVVWLWRDPGTTDECFQLFERYLNSQLNSPTKPDGD